MAVLKRWTDIAPDGEVFRPVRDLYTRRRVLGLHTHDYVEISWIDRGRARHQINGEDKWVEPGSLVFIRAEDHHAISPVGNETLALTNIAFPSVVCDSLRRQYPSEMGDAFRWGESFGTAMALETAQRRTLNTWADELFLASRHSAMPIDRFVLNLLTLLSRREAHARPAIPPAAPDWLGC